jgi:murein DD-endopeptidase MepM/ murein hydrolase activator NlpD
MGGGGSGAQDRESREVLDQRGLFVTGLQPVFPTGVTCPQISSPFGSPTRYDGSQRSNDFGGLHNGMDISLEPGTPLLAVADGVVAHAGTGGQLVGNFIWLHFPPESTGLPVHVFARYQHLREPAALQPGAPVRQGQVVGLSGNTGTTGGHYGFSGYDHLHLNLLVSPDPDFETAGPMLRPSAIVYLDPLGLYARPAGGILTSQSLRGLADDQKRLPVSVMTTEGQRIGAPAKPIWPVACKRDFRE